MREQTQQRLDVFLDRHRYAWLVAALVCAVLVVLVLVYAVCLELPSIVKDAMQSLRKRVYRRMVQRTATCIRISNLISYDKTNEFINDLQEWCDQVDIKLYQLDGPLLQKLPYSGRAVIVDLSLHLKDSNRLFFLTSSDAMLYKLAF